MSRRIAKITAFLAAGTMLISMIACNSSIDNSQYSLSKITLSDTENAWSNPEEEYADLLETYGSNTCAGALAVATDKDLVYLYCEDDVEKDGTTPVSQNTVFDIASMSKVFTAVSILQLAEKGKLSIEDTLDKYFPEYETGKNVTIYNLLHMNSGISDYLNNPDPFWNISGADAANKQLSDIYLDKTTDDEFLAALYQAPLEFEPGSKYAYSNTNYRLLAMIIEQITGKKYCDYVKKNIFDKCGMTKTSSMATGDLTYAPRDFEELAEYGFCSEDGYPACPNNSRGDGGIHSCLTDMVAFDRALFGGKLLNEKSMEALLKEEKSYCCGLKKESTGYAHDGSSLTCSGNNKIIESEEYGHIYVITLIHSGESDHADSLYAPMKGTNYTKGIFENHVYTNEYADLKINLPDEYYSMSESIMEMSRNETISDSTDDTDKALESAKTWDIVLMGKDIIEVDFLNTKLVAKNHPNYTADDYLDDWVDSETRECPKYGYDVQVKEREKKFLGGNEYIRQHIILSGSGETGDFYKYARKLDDSLICLIDTSTWEGTAIESIEAMFE